jgi:hydroxyacylglutathione hydrolase
VAGVFIAGFPLGALAANCYVVAAAPGEPCVVIDPGEDALPQVQAVVAEQGLQVNSVLLTHGHLDHAASFGAVADAYEVEGMVHPADEYMLDDPLSALSPELRSMLAGYPVPRMRPDEELILLEPGDRIDVDGFVLAVDVTPGHTGGSVVFRLDGTKDRPTILFTGDTLFAGSVGRTDLPGGSTEQLNASLDALLAASPDDAVILPGHGPTSTIGAERAANPFLAGLGARKKRWFGA